MVNREEVTLKIKDVAETLKTARLVRNESGAWTLVIEIDGELKIDNSRSLRVEGDVRIRGRQKGRKQ